MKIIGGVTLTGGMFLGSAGNSASSDNNTQPGSGGSGNSTPPSSGGSGGSSGPSYSSTWTSTNTSPSPTTQLQWASASSDPSTDANGGASDLVIFNPDTGDVLGRLAYPEPSTFSTGWDYWGKYAYDTATHLYVSLPRSASSNSAGRIFVYTKDAYGLPSGTPTVINPPSPASSATMSFFGSIFYVIGDYLFVSESKFNDTEGRIAVYQISTGFTHFRNFTLSDFGASSQPLSINLGSIQFYQSGNSLIIGMPNYTNPIPPDGMFISPTQTGQVAVIDTTTMTASGTTGVRLVRPSSQVQGSKFGEYIEANDTRFIVSWAGPAGTTGGSLDVYQTSDLTVTSHTGLDYIAGQFHLWGSYLIRQSGNTVKYWSFPSMSYQGAITMPGGLTFQRIVLSGSRVLLVNWQWQTAYMFNLQYSLVNPVRTYTWSGLGYDAVARYIGLSTRNTVNAAPTASYSLSTVGSSVDEGSSIQVTVSTTFVVANTVLYWTITNGSEFTASSGTVTIGTDGTGVFFLTAIADQITDGSLTITISLRTDSNSGPVVTTCPCTVNDTSQAVVIDTNTEINIFFDTSGSMNTSLTPMQTMKTDVLKNALLPFYNNDGDIYDSNVNFIEEPNERVWDQMNTMGSNANITQVINLVFSDENSPYGAGGQYPTDRTTQHDTDIAALRSDVNSGISSNGEDYFRGVLFQIDTGPGTYPGYKSYVTAVINGTGNYSGTNGLSDFTDEIAVNTDVIAASNATYYANQVISALNGLGYTSINTIAY